MNLGLVNMNKHELKSLLENIYTALIEADIPDNPPKPPSYNPLPQEPWPWPPNPLSPTAPPVTPTITPYDPVVLDPGLNQRTDRVILVIFQQYIPLNRLNHRLSLENFGIGMLL